MEAKDTQLQQKDGQIERQGAEIKEKATQISRQQRELQTLKVRNWRKILCVYEFMTTSLNLMLGGQGKAADRGGK